MAEVGMEVLQWTKHDVAQLGRSDAELDPLVWQQLLIEMVHGILGSLRSGQGLQKSSVNVIDNDAQCMLGTKLPFL
jgi:hypothetical protein